jgi:hypothetical protein
VLDLCRHLQAVAAAHMMNSSSRKNVVIVHTLINLTHHQIQVVLVVMYVTSRKRERGTVDSIEQLQLLLLVMTAVVVVITGTVEMIAAVVVDQTSAEGAVMIMAMIMHTGKFETLDVACTVTQLVC